MTVIPVVYVFLLVSSFIRSFHALSITETRPSFPSSVQISSRLLPSLPISLLIPRRPSFHSGGHCLVAFALLLIGGTEPNPGPIASTGTHSRPSSTRGIQAVLLKIRSAVNKAALIHDTIIAHHIDIFLLSRKPGYVPMILLPSYRTFHRLGFLAYTFTGICRKRPGVVEFL